jgi:nucleotide-binding universal stress UspA family protein
MYKKILLASHGTDGARAAEKAALALAVKGGTIHHLVVVPDFWKGMQGDDWLNNASTRDIFKNYVESELEGEVMRDVKRVSQAAAKRGAKYRSHIVLGKPSEQLVQACARLKPQIVVTGSPRPKTAKGLRSRMLTDDVLREVDVPLFVAPYPRGS